MFYTDKTAVSTIIITIIIMIISNKNNNIKRVQYIINLTRR